MFRSKISSWERTDMKLYNRGSSYYTILTIPRCLVSEYGKKQIWKSLRTNDYKLAKLRAEFETMAIRQKLLNDVKKIKAQNQTADLYFDDDDEETDDIQVEDKMDFSQFSDEDFLNADDKTISLMGNETFSKYHKIKYAYDKKMARINKIRNSTIEYDQREAEDFAYDWLLAKAQHETKRLQNVTNKAEERKYYQDLLNAFEYKYTQWDYRDIENEVKTYFYEKIISQPSPDTKDIVLNAFMRAKIQFLRYIIEYIKGYRGEIDPELINSVYYNQLEINAHLKEEMNRKPDVTLMQVVEYYNKTPKRDNTSEETKERVAAKMNIMADLLGTNKPIRKITSDDIQELLYTVSYIPKHFGIGKTQGKTIQEAVNMARADETLPRISVKTQGDYVQTLSSVFKWALAKEFIDKNPMIAAELPAQDIKAQRGEKYLPFNIPQLQAIFNLPIYRGCLNEKNGRLKPGKKIIRDTFFWIPLIALYTGARLNEICQLTTEDIITKDGIDCFSINDNAGKRVKTLAGIRVVPIHPTLKKIGFLQYVEQRRLDKHNKNQILFPAFNDNKRDGLSGYFSKWFNRTLDKVNETISNPDDKLQKHHVFHSFRHTVRTEYRNHGTVEERVEILCGWESDTKSLSKHYGSISIKELYKTISKDLTYTGLDLAYLYI